MTDQFQKRSDQLKSRYVPYVLMIALGAVVVTCNLKQSPTALAADSKRSIGARGAALFVDVSHLNVVDAKRAIQGRNLRVRGTPSGESKSGSMILTAKDGTIAVTGIPLSNDIEKHMSEGHQVTVDMEGSIKLSKSKGSAGFYASEVRRLTWEARDESGNVVDRGERKGNE